MRKAMRALIAFLLLACGVAVQGAEIVRVPPWEFHNSFWMSLHQTLLEDVHAQRKLTGLSAEEQATWNQAVAAYRTAAGRNPIFADPIVITDDAITQVADDAKEPLIDAPLAETLKRAAPIYRAHWWTADEKSNRFFITYAAAMLREAGDDLVRAHAAAYRTPWPDHIHVYIAPYGGPVGAYTHYGRAGGAMTIMSSRGPGYQGLRAVEMLLHESSHTVVNPNRGTVASAIAASAKKRGIDPPPDLWHAILFETSSELARRWLAGHGSADFVPSSQDMFTRVWPQYRESVENYWIPYIAGHGTLEEAIDQIVSALPQKTGADR
jgi:hypothetical protein